MELHEYVADFARGIELVDAKRPVALNQRTKQPYQPGIGPHTEAATVSLVMNTMATEKPERYRDAFAENVPYPDVPRQRCDLVLGAEEPYDWVIEVKMLRMLGDNGKPNDNMVSHILSPYPQTRSAVTDLEKLAATSLGESKAVLWYCYEYPDWPADPLLDAFGALTAGRLGERFEASFSGLIHPVHQVGRVVGWELQATDAPATP